MGISSNLYILENWTCFLIEVKSIFQSPYINWCRALIVVLFMWGYCIYFVAITFLPLLLFFSHCCSFSHMVLYFLNDEMIKLLKFI
jgi:hypothetical protein